MTGSQLHTMLLDNGASLHLDAHGQLTIKPAAVAQRYRSGIQDHLCYLLTAAAIAEVQRLLHTHSLTLTSVRPMVSIEMLNAACASGEVNTTRQAAVAYVDGWRQWVQGDAA